jgi:hypothetical protein
LSSPTETGKVADYILVWGEYYKDLYVKQNIRKPEDIYVLGYPFLIKKGKIGPKGYSKKNSRCIVYYLGQNFEVYDKIFFNIKIETVKKVNKICNRLGMRFIYRPHPLEDRLLSEEKLPEIYFSPKKEKIEDSIAKGDIFISVNSTSLVEASIRQKISLQLMNYSIKSDNFEQLGACNKSFKTIEELGSYLEKLVNAPDLDKFKPKFNNNYIETRYNPGQRFLEIIEEIKKQVHFKMIKVTEKTKIYIVAPANMATGGPEELHQLGAALNKIGLNAFMYYTPTNHPSPVYPEYKQYKVPFLNNINDDSHNILIVPEPFGYITFLNNFSNIQKLIWWMSVDNFYLSYYFTNNKNIKKFILRVANKLSKFIIKEPMFDLPKIALKACKDFNFSNDMIIPKVNLYLVQSDYAKQHLLEKGITNIEYLSGYLDDEFLLYNYTINSKENLVLFNPKKGIKFTKKIMSYAHDIKFLPIQNMSKREVIDIMKKAKVYIDFGNHPGKDKIPREAAICGCCVITGKRGSAAFYKDVPLSDRYKFEEKKDNIPKIVDTIEYCIGNYKEAVKDFDGYREIIRKEKNRFMEDVQRIFSKVS